MAKTNLRPNVIQKLGHMQLQPRLILHEQLQLRPQFKNATTMHMQLQPQPGDTASAPVRCSVNSLHGGCSERSHGNAATAQVKYLANCFAELSFPQTFR